MRWIFALLGILGTWSISSAADWPQWLGPQRDGSVSDAIKPWKGDLKVLWSKPVEEGNSSPIVAGGLVYLHTKVKGKDEERLVAYDAATGATKWEQVYPKAAFKPAFGEGPRATPCFADGKIFSFGNTGVLAAWDAASGKPLWNVDTLKEFKVPNLFFGISASPIVIGKNVVVMVGKGTAVAAFDTTSGKLTWKSGADAASYSSPISVGEGDKAQLVTLTGENLLALRANGDEAWKTPFKDRINESSTTPVKVGDIYVASSVTVGAIAVKIKEQEGKATVEPLWKNPALTCYFSTPVLAGKDHLYMVTGVASLTSASISLRCVEVATGKEIWNQPKVGKYHAALLKLKDGNLLMLDDMGNLILLAPNTAKYEELARSKICGSTWAHPAISDGKIFVRDDKEIRCLELK